jgi:hypothetical protein
VSDFRFAIDKKREEEKKLRIENRRSRIEKAKNLPTCNLINLPT